jgi:AraC family transcriptional regulator, transcriptional activator FtrA
MPILSAPLVVLLAFDGLCTFEYGCAFEIFGLTRPEAGPGWYRFKIAAAEPGPLRGAGGVEVRADGSLELLDDAFMAVIPGWRGPDAPVPTPLLTALRAAHARGCRLVSICSEAFVLAAAGLLAGKRATTHWLHAEKLASRYPDVRVVSDVLYVDEGSVLTSAGSAAGLDLCLHVVRRDFGARVANEVARRLVMPAHRDGGQFQFISRPVPRRAGTRLMSLLDRIRTRLDEEWPLTRIASEARLSVRSVHRHMRDTTGMAPGAWLLAERISRARDLLEETALPVAEIARQVGFNDAGLLRAHFRKMVGVAPRTYRIRFG